MALIFCEGWDKYGAANTNSAGVAAMLTAGEWTSASASNIALVTGLSATGFAFQVSNLASIQKTLSASYSRLIGGFRFSFNFGTAIAGLQLYDAGTAQCAVSINGATGAISVRNGSYLSGTILGTSGATVSANTTHYLEFDIPFGNSAAYQLWLDGVSILLGTGDTTATANNTANGVGFICNSGTFNLTVDDFYLFDTSGSTNNAVLLTSPRIETQFPTSDGAVQFAVGAGILGSSVARSASAVSTAVNQLRLRTVVSGSACTLTSVSFLAGNVASGTINLRPVVYADSSGAPGTLLGSGSTSTGTTANATKTMPLTSGVSLSAGVSYWIGYMCDISASNALAQTEAAFTDRTATSTFASGAPGTAPAMTASAGTVIWGNVTGQANWATVDQNPNDGALSYVFDANVGHEDLYNFPALSALPSAIYAVAVKASLSKSDAGAKTASVRLKSGATDSAGTGGTALAPGTSYGWMTSHYPTDPATSAAWTLGGLNSAQCGVKVET